MTAREEIINRFLKFAMQTVQETGVCYDDVQKILREFLISIEND